MNNMATNSKDDFNICSIGKSKTFKEAFTTDFFIEKFNKPLLNHIINNWDSYKNNIIDTNDNGGVSSYEPKTIIDNYLKKSGKNDYVSVKYKKSISSLKDGRWFADKALSIQNLPRPIRHTICKDIWIDLDFVNCHPIILEHLCNCYKINCYYLSNYNSNRQSFLQTICDKLGCSRDDAKKNILKTLNGGNVDIDIDWWPKLKKEFKNIASSISSKDEFKKIYSHTESLKKYNVEARTMNYILCIYENKCLESLYEFLTDNGVIKNFNCSLIFDGLQVLKNDYNTEKLTQDFLNTASTHIKNQIGIYLDISIKDFNEGFDIILNIDDVSPPSYNLKSYDDTKKEFEENTFKIRHPPMIITKNDYGYQYQSLKSFRESYQDIQYIIKNKDKKDKIKSFVPDWLNDSDIRCYDRLVFKPPPLKIDGNEFNTWEPFKIIDEPLIKTERNYWEEYKTYAMNLFNNKRIVDIIFARYAQRLQYPAKRTYICLIICGTEGDGKNRFLEPIYRIFGDKYVETLDSAKKLYETHSTYEKEKLLLLINEAGGISNFENSDILKARITEAKLSVNPKGIHPYTIDLLCDYDMTTNNRNVVKITDDSVRRFFQVETTDYYRGNFEFFNDYSKNIVDNPTALRQIYEGLMNFNIDEIIPSGNFQTDKPSTEIENEVKQNNRDKILYFIEDFINGRDNDNENKDISNILKFHNQFLFDKWKVWCSDNNVKFDINKQQFGSKISLLIKTKINKDFKCITKDTSHSTTTFNIEECKKFFKKLNGFNFIKENE
jgi:hypothetical protein